MGKSKKEMATRARELLRGEWAETLKLTAVYTVLWGTPDVHELNWVIDERLRQIAKSLATSN